MGRSHGIDWSKYGDKATELYLSGIGRARAAEILTEIAGEFVSVDGFNGAIDRLKHLGKTSGHVIEDKNNVPIFKEDTIPDGDYMLSCDYHSPYYSEVWVNRILAMAAKLGIREHIVIGDLFDFDFMKHFYSERPSTIDKEIEETKPIFKALDYFDKNYLIQGNHERRIGIQSCGKLQARHLLRTFGPEIWDKKFRYSEYDRMFIGDKWMVVHPKSYSQISASVAVRLAEKFHRHVINAHGHFIAMRYDRSGEYMCIDLGGIFEPSKIEYCSLRSTTHPTWNQGFGAILDGHFYHFHTGTDWKYWLGENK
jgi:hypothetical protein